MEIKGKVRLFFEQSGTFKNEFKKLGVNAEDYDILNDFGETEHVCDLFKAIEDAYDHLPSVFDSISKDDLIFAFFPCTKFSARVPVNARGENFGMKDWSIEKKIEYSRETVEGINHNYGLFCKMVLIALRKGLRMIIENPYTAPHFLTQYFPIRPAVIDKDRTERGDYYTKPTQFFFINCEPSHNEFPDENLKRERVTTIEKCEIEFGDKKLPREKKRSMICPVYANRFIREFIL